MKNRTAPKRGKVKSQLLKRPLNSMTKAAHTRDVPKSQRKGAKSKTVALESLTVPQLRELCLDRDIGVNSKMRKAELIDLLVKS